MAGQTIADYISMHKQTHFHEVEHKYVLRDMTAWGFEEYIDVSSVSYYIMLNVNFS